MNYTIAVIEKSGRLQYLCEFFRTQDEAAEACKGYVEKADRFMCMAVTNKRGKIYEAIAKNMDRQKLYNGKAVL